MLSYKTLPGSSKFFTELLYGILNLFNKKHGGPKCLQMKQMAGCSSIAALCSILRRCKTLKGIVKPIFKHSAAINN
jgi:hypothetical protein